MFALPTVGGLLSGAWSLYGKQISGGLAILAVWAVIQGGLAIKGWQEREVGREDERATINEVAIERAILERAAEQGIDNATSEQLRACLTDPGATCVFNFVGVRRVPKPPGLLSWRVPRGPAFDLEFVPPRSGRLFDD